MVYYFLMISNKQTSVRLVLDRLDEIEYTFLFISILLVCTSTNGLQVLHSNLFHKE